MQWVFTTNWRKNQCICHLELQNKNQLQSMSIAMGTNPFIPVGQTGWILKRGIDHVDKQTVNSRTNLSVHWLFWLSETQVMRNSP